jgi:hypothetical protein
MFGHSEVTRHQLVKVLQRTSHSGVYLVAKRRALKPDRKARTPAYRLESGESGRGGLGGEKLM